MPWGNEQYLRTMDTGCIIHAITFNPIVKYLKYIFCSPRANPGNSLQMSFFYLIRFSSQSNNINVISKTLNK